MRSSAALLFATIALAIAARPVRAHPGSVVSPEVSPADDDSIPFTESLRLAEAADGRARVAILRTFTHVGPDPFWRSLRLRAVDGWNLFRLADELLPH